MNTLIRFLRDRRAVSPVIGTILMVAITVVMGAIVGGFVYQTGKPKMAPNLSTTLEDDVRITLLKNVSASDGTANEGRIAKLYIESGARIAPADLNAICTYMDGTTINDVPTPVEQTVTLDGASWVIGTAKSMGLIKIGLKWVDSDGSTDVSPGDRLDFMEMSTFDTATPPLALSSVAAQNVKGNTDLTVKIVHKSSESVLATHTIRVY